MENELGKFRTRHSLSQREAAEWVGVGLSTWQQLEQGFRGRRPPLQLIRHLEALDANAAAGPPVGSLTLDLLAEEIVERHRHRPWAVDSLISLLRTKLRDQRERQKQAKEREAVELADLWFDDLFGGGREEQLARKMLGLGRGRLSYEEVHAAYGAKAMKLHPDHGGGGDSDTMAALQAAREVLRGLVKRAG